MQKHAIGLEELFEDNFFLIGIHTTLEDFRLAYLLNQTLKTHLKKDKQSLIFKRQKKSSAFTIFTYNSPKYEDRWDLISNCSVVDVKKNENELLLPSQIRTYLIPERKKIDYFIKITGNITQDYIKKTVKKIQSIDQIITSYFIDKNTLKSKEYLIF